MNPYVKSAIIRNPVLYRILLGVSGNAESKLETLTYLKCVRDGDVVVEVGSNHGHYTAILSHIVGREGKVHAFEPVPPTFELLSQSVMATTRFKNVVLNNAAVGDAQGKVAIHVPAGDSGQASMRTHAAVASWDRPSEVTTYDCEVCRLDDYFGDSSFGVPTFFKIDVEGAELLVLKGAVGLLKRFHPLIHLEICYSWSRSFGYAPSDLVSFLEGIGYTDFYLCDQDIRYLPDPHKELNPDLLPTSANLLCAVGEEHRTRLPSRTTKLSL